MAKDIPVVGVKFWAIGNDMYADTGTAGQHALFHYVKQALNPLA